MLINKTIKGYEKHFLRNLLYAYTLKIKPVPIRPISISSRPENIFSKNVKDTIPGGEKTHIL